MKQFVKALDKQGSCFEYIGHVFPGISTKKLKAGIFDGPQIRKLIKNSNFVHKMNVAEATAWKSFVQLTQKFLGNIRDDNYKEIVKNCLASFRLLGFNMSIKVHSLFSHLENFPINLGYVSDEQGEKFHQDGVRLCWSLKRDCRNIIHRRQVAKKNVTIIQIQCNPVKPNFQGTGN